MAEEQKLEVSNSSNPLYPIKGLGAVMPRQQSDAIEAKADSTILPPRETGSVNEQGNQPHDYWLFATADL